MPTQRSVRPQPSRQAVPHELVNFRAVRGRCARRGVSMVASLSETDSHPEDLLRVCESSDPQVVPAASNVLTKCSIEVRPVRSVDAE